MILVDRRIGSNDLLKPLQQAGLEAKLVELEFGDIAFEGKGEQGASLNIGVEFKRLGDLISSLRSGRLAGHQLPGLLKTYDRAWLLIEGNWQHNEQGLVTSFQKGRGWTPVHGKMTAAELETTVLTLELCGGLHVRYVNTRRDTLRFLSNLYRWWTDRALDGHHSHLAVHTPPATFEVSAFRAAVCQWPGIGLKTSRAVEQAFHGSITKAAAASVETWASIETGDSAGKRGG